MRFATRLNSFASRPDLAWPGAAGRPTTAQLIERAAKVRGLTDVDINYPDHLRTLGAAELRKLLADLGLSLNGFAMRYYGDPAYKLGAFTHPSAAQRRKAIDLTKRGVDELVAAGGDLMTLWLGQDGFDYPFQVDYRALWEWEVEGIREVAAHNPAVQVSVEYKPNEPRAFSLLGDLGTTLLAVREADRPNLGVTLDFAHVLYAGEQPAMVAALVNARSRLLGVHLNDAYSHRDDGLMVGAIHAAQTLELLWQLRRDGYQGPLYFDTFPDASGLDPVAECQVNIGTVQRLLGAAARLDADGALAAAVAAHDAVTATRLVQEAIFGHLPEAR